MTLPSLSKRRLFGALLVSSTLIGQVQAGIVASHVTDKDGQSLTGMVVFATPIDAPTPPAKSARTVIIAQEKAVFFPYVTVIRAGTYVRFPNHDPYDHHLKSFSSPKTFDFRIDRKKEGPPPVLFDKPGEVVMTCYFHDWMRGYIYVVDTPYFAKTDKEGNALLNDLPVGKYEVKAWAPSMIGPPLAKTVEVTDGATKVSFQFDFVPKPPPTPKPTVTKDSNY